MSGQSRRNVPASFTPGQLVELFTEAARRHRAGDREGTEQAVRHILLIAPDSGEAWSNLGVCRQKAGELAAAVVAYRRAIRLSPIYAEAVFNLISALKAEGRSEDVAATLRQAAAVLPEEAQILFRLGIAQAEAGLIEEAVLSYERAVELRLDHAEAWSNLGNLKKQAGQRGAALAAYRQAVVSDPGFSGAWCNLCTTLCDAERFGEALAAGRYAVAADPSLFLAHHDLGIALKRKRENAAARDSYRRALALKPDHAEAWSNLGGTIEDPRHFPLAATAFRRSVAADPAYAEGHFNLGFSLLRSGRWAEGWREYEWRRHPRVSSGKVRDFSQPQWDGSPGAGTVLIHAEQGLGDTIQFCRYASLAAQRVRVVLEVQRPIKALLSGLPGVKVIAAGDPLPDFASHCPLLSLPGLLGTTPESIPAPIPYISADPARIARWRERLPPGRFRIGVVWQGSPAYKGDHLRSATLAAFEPLARLPGVTLISLQKGAGTEQLNALPSKMAVARLGEDFDAGPDAFLDAAAVISCLDLVVGVDTALLHLAGALGCPAWLALSSYPHWCWLDKGEATAWYPSLRLFRQEWPGDWQGVFRAMADQLLGDALMDRSARYFAAGNPQEAGDGLKTVLALRPGDAPAWSNRAACLDAAGQPDVAETPCRRAIKLTPLQTELHCNLGNSLTSLGLAAAAKRAYRSAVALAPGVARAYSGLGNLHVRAARFAAAILSFERALTLGGEDASLRQCLDDALQRMK